MIEPNRLEGSLVLEGKADSTAVAKGAADDVRWARGAGRCRAGSLGTSPSLERPGTKRC